MAPELPATAVLSALRTAGPLAMAPTGEDGRTRGSLTGRGMPFEASVSGSGQVEPTLRWVVEGGADRPFFRPRLLAQRRVVDALVARLPPDAVGLAQGEIDAVFAAVVPDAAAVPARSQRRVYAGVVQRADDGAGALSAVKLYGVLPDSGVTAPIAAGGASPLPAWLADPALRRSMIGLEVAGDGGVARKLYLRTTAPLDDAEAAALVERMVPGSAWVSARLVEAGFARWWRRPVFVCRRVDGDGAVSVSLHGRAGTAGAVSGAVRHLARHLHGTEAGADALTIAGAACGVPWSFTMVGVGLGPSGATVRLNLYAAPDRLA